MSILKAPLVLVGMPGSGKTTLGKSLASFLGAPFIDTDQQIEQTSGKPISLIFQQEGENLFRKLEKKALLQALVATPPAVIAVGGGAVELPETRAILEKNPVLFLDVPLEVLQFRVKDDRIRPLLVGDRAEKMAELFLRRQRLFSRFPRIPWINGLHVLGEIPRLLHSVQGLFPGMVHFPSLPVDFPTPHPLRWIAGEMALFQKKECPSCFSITSQNVARLYPSFFSEASQVLPDGEDAKSLPSLESLYSQALSRAIDKDQRVCAIGGGTITDVAGLFAATFKRGLPLHLFPTTLLAQVDAAIGGKNAINLQGVKNCVGTIRMPQMTWVDPLLSLSAPPSSFFDGLVEGLKVSFLVHSSSEILRQQLQRARGLLDSPCFEELSAFTIQAIHDKCRILSEDVMEKGQRLFLNLGHTLGHVYETTYSLSHGQAVALGLLHGLEKKKHPVIEEFVEWLQQVLGPQTLALREKPWTPEMAQKLSNDKKNRNQKIILVDLQAPGQPFLKELELSSLLSSLDQE
ncbi:MAG TPA: shikimate kinase [Thermotogota bacterium]|mgnify:CR=1 FL=1|nr:shikimate kinase [Thermotogota bacterium]